MTSQANPLQPLNGSDVDRHYYFMQEALLMAQSAAQDNEVPVGAVLVQDDVIIARAHNAPIQLNDPTAHAEIQCFRAAGSAKKNYRLVNCSLYVTLEPCMMCVGAIIHARIEQLIFGAYDLRAGAVISQYEGLNQSFHNHRLKVTGGIFAQESQILLKNFFKVRRS